jgi:tetratricopeptide (TPR) repeat protein
LADVLYAQGRYEEAEQYTQISENASAPDDYASQILWRSARAKAIASQGRLDEGKQLAREAVALTQDTDNIDLRGDALIALAEVLRLADRPEEAATVGEHALRLYEQKGNVVSAGKARALLAEMRLPS